MITDLSGLTTGLGLEIFCPECGNASDRASAYGSGPHSLPGDASVLVAPNRWGDGDHQSVTVHQDRDDRDAPNGLRGGYVQIDLCCASGHEYALIVGNHKGSEFVGLVKRVCELRKFDA